MEYRRKVFRGDTPPGELYDWGGYQRVLPPVVEHHITKSRTQRFTRTNGIVRQQTGRFHRRQNKFSKQWRRTEMTVRLVVSYFNWIWCDSRTATTAAERAGLTFYNWDWQDFATYSTLL